MAERHMKVHIREREKKEGKRKKRLEASHHPRKISAPVIVTVHLFLSLLIALLKTYKHTRQ